MFIYTIVNVGSEKLLKEEISIKYPHLKFAYSRPGYITFKDTTESFNVDTQLDLIFARSYGLSLGKFSKEEVEEEIKKYKDATIHRFSFVNDEIEGKKALINKDILDVMEIKEGEYWLGLRKARFFSWFYPFAKLQLEIPEDCPSRAYLKLIEAFAWTNYNPLEDEVALELGSSPGGASYAMLKKGIKVYGVDNALMDENLLKNPLFTHIKEPMQKVRDEHIPRPCHLLIADVNVMPSLAMAQIKRFMALRPGIKNVFYTLEIGSKIKVPEILSHIQTFKRFGFREVGVTQLPSNKSEILLYGKRK